MTFCCKEFFFEKNNREWVMNFWFADFTVKTKYGGS